MELVLFILYLVLDGGDFYSLSRTLVFFISYLEGVFLA